MEINNNIAVVTGGGSGMGAATAKHFAQAGAQLALLDLNQQAAENTAEEINQAGGKAIAIKCDVSDAASVADALSIAGDSLGPARICVNCAGIAPAKRIVGKEGPMPLDHFAKVINVNLLGTFNVMRLVAAEMAKLNACNDSKEQGVIINTASIAAYEGQIGQAAYSASKGGVVALTLPAAREFARFGVRVVTIAPGIMATPMMSAMPQPVQDSLAAMIPFPSRLGFAEEYASLAAHIVTNSYLNGEVIRLDGAIRMQPK